MNKRVPALPFMFVLFFLLFPNLACKEKGPPLESTQAVEIYGSLSVNGAERTYLLHLPTSYPTDEEVPLLLAFHGGGGDGEGMEKLTHLSEVSDREGFIVVFPDGMNRQWNDGRPEINPGVDDISFVLKLLDDLEGKYNIDRGRIYATGISNGGFFCFRLACELHGVIAAIAPVGCLMGEALAQKTPSPQPIPIMLTFGEDDPLVPQEGGEIRGFGKERGSVLSFRATVSFWVKANSCSPSPTVNYEPDKISGDGTRVRREVYSAEGAGSELILLVIEGGGHTWPGGLQYLPERTIGKTCRDIDASEAIWDFLSQQHL